MRGCLFVLVLAAALIGSIAWFAAEPIADAVIAAVLNGSQVRAATMTVTTVADPPPKLLIGRADRITIEATDATWTTLRAASLTLVLDEVDFISRTAATIHGTITGADIGGDAALNPSPVASIDIDGPANAAAATITVDRASIRASLLAAVHRSFGVTATDVVLLPPDRLRLVAPGATLEGSIVIDPAGGLALSTPLGTVTMLTVDPDIPIRLDSVAVVADALRIDATLDATDLLRG
jgi:hypothetical protein